MKNTWIKIFLIISFCLTSTVTYAQFHQLTFQNISVEDGLSQNTITCIGQDTLGYMWFGTFNGLNKFDGYDFTQYRSDSENSHGLNIDRTINILTDSEGNLWIRTIDSAFYQYDYYKDYFTPYHIDSVPEFVKGVAKKQYGIEIFKFGNHQFEFQREKDRQFTYTNLETDKVTEDVVKKDSAQGIRDSYITSLFIDNSDNLWVGTFSSGLYIAELKNKEFEQFSFSSSSHKNLNNIRAIYQDNDKSLWLGTRDNGLLHIDSNYQIISHYKHDYNDVNSLNSNDIRKIYRDTKGRLWIGMRGGVSLYNDASNNFITIMKGSVDSIETYVFNIYEDSDSVLWFASLSGLLRYDNRSYKLERVGVDDGVDFDPALRVIIEDNKNNLWIGSEVGGVACVKKAEESEGEVVEFKTIKYLNKSNCANCLSDNRVYSVAKDNHGDIWFGTGSGLNRYNSTEDVFDVLNISNGLAENWILGILPDSDNNIWVSHKQGISKININDLSVENFSDADGANAGELNEDAYFINQQTGEMFFGGSKGFIHFNPEKIKSDSDSLRILINDLYINGEKVGIGDTINDRVVLEKSLIFTSKINLKYSDRSFSLGFSAIDFTNSENIQYQYMLEGFDKKWIASNSKIRRAFYTNLNSGKYRFKVKINRGRIEDDEIAFIDIEVKPPIWFQKWFLILLSFLIIALLYSRYHRIKKQKRILEIRVEERTHELNTKNKQVKKQLSKIKEQNKTIANNHEEMLAQSEKLKEQNQSLEKAFQELDLYKNKLESLVDKRTKELSIAKQKAEESDRLKSSFLSNLSHEVRTPLNAIMGFSTLIFDDGLEIDEKLKYKDITIENCNELLMLIENIVEYSMIEASSIEPNKNKVSVLTLMGQFFQICEVQQTKNSSSGSETSNIEFKLNNQIEDISFEVYTDAQRVVQIMTQLIDNALKFTHEGFIEIGCSINSDKKCVTFYVKDTGIGISQEDQTLIFNSFTKLEFYQNDIYRGVGIGLSIALQLIRLLGGELHVQSELGSGSTFSFDLPLGS